MGVEARDGEGEDEVQHVDYSFGDFMAAVGRAMYGIYTGL
jgi:hypothetical protein